MADGRRAPRDVHLMTTDRLVADLIGGRVVALSAGDHEFGLILDHLDHSSAIETAERLGCCIAATPLDLGGSNMPSRRRSASRRSRRATAPTT